MVHVGPTRTIYIASREPDGEEAASRIRAIIKEPEIGKECNGRVVSILPFGAVVELILGKDDLLNVSRLAQGLVGKVENVLNVGDAVHLKIIDIDDRGRVPLDRPDKPLAPPCTEGPGGGGVAAGETTTADPGRGRAGHSCPNPTKAHPSRGGVALPSYEWSRQSALRPETCAAPMAKRL